VVTVLDGPPESVNSQPVYELHARTFSRYKPVGEEGVAIQTARMSAAINFPLTDMAGRFNGSYAAFVREGMPCHIVGIFRIRFRVSNPKNHTVTSAWQRIGSNQREIRAWLDELENGEPPPVLPSTIQTFEFQVQTNESPSIAESAKTQPIQTASKGEQFHETKEEYKKRRLQEIEEVNANRAQRNGSIE